MSDIKDLVVIEKTNALSVFTIQEQLDPIIEAIEKEARSLVPDLSTKKGRDAIASMAHKVARSKTYIDNAGKELVAELKALPKQIDESRRLVRDRLDALKDEVRQPLTEWEAEQERIKAEEVMNAMHEEALAMNAAFDLKRSAKIEADHEMALLMNEKFDRDAVEAKAEKERKRIAYEEELKRLAENAARLAMEQEAQREREESAHREAVLKAQAEQAERERIEAEQRAEREKKEAAEKAERDKQQAIAEEQRKAHEEAERIKRENEQKEQTRLAEEKRIKDENELRENDLNNRKIVNNSILNKLIEIGADKELAIKIITEAAKGNIKNLKVVY